MMKKTTLIAVVSLFVFGGVLGLLGESLAGSPPCIIDTPGKSYKSLASPDCLGPGLSGIEAMIIIMPGGKVLPVMGNNVNPKKPKKMGGGPITLPASIPPDMKNRDELPSGLELDVSGNPYPEWTIKIYGNTTCWWIGGVQSCYP